MCTAWAIELGKHTWSSMQTQPIESYQCGSLTNVKRWQDKIEEFLAGKFHKMSTSSQRIHSMFA